MNNEVLNAIKTRRSIRKYKAEQITDEQLDAILEAGTYAATGMGKQSPVIVVVQKPELIAKLSKMNAAHAVGVDSCWIHRAKEEFASPEGKALLKEWGLSENYVGIGHCILGYRDCEYPEAKERKADYIVRV